MEKNQIIKNNAISSYLMIGISWLFLFNKNNNNINNDFVKNHTKAAFILHFFIFLNIILFRFYKIFWGININFFNLFNTNLNILISNIFLAISIFIIFLWCYKAYKWELFKIWEILKFKSDKNLLDINKDWNFWEKDKVTFVLTFIPFLWQIISSKYKKNEIIREILKLNIFVSLIFCLLFINFYNNLNQILILLYMIFVAFVWVNLFAKSEILTINLPKYFDFSEIWINFKISIIYLKKYFSGNFEEFVILKEKYNKKIEEENEKTKLEMEKLPELKWAKKIIYFPILNLYFLFFKENNFQIHIKNALTISFLIIFSIILIILKIISVKYLILFLFPISAWIWNLSKNNYKIPVIFDIYNIFINFKNFFKKSKKFISEKRKEVNEVNLKVWENKIPEKTEEKISKI